MEYPLIPGYLFFKSDQLYELTVTEESPYLMKHYHDYVEIAYVVEGEGLHYIGEKLIRVSQGDLFVIPIGETHVFQPLNLNGERPLKIMNCLLNIERLTHEQLQYMSEARGYRDHDAACKRILEQMLIERQSPIGEQMPGSAGYELCIQLLELLSNRLRNGEEHHVIGKEEVPIHQALHVMGHQHQVRDALTLPDISHFVSLSTRHFQRLFKSLTGRSYTQMLQEIRIQHSCGMLLYSQWSIQTIAERVGIHDMQYFYRLFKTYCGMTPAAFRKAYFREKLI